MTHTQRESVFAIPPFACVRTISGVPTPNKPPSDPINMDNPVLLLLPVLCEDEGGRRTVVGGAARNDVLRDTERGVARNAEVAVTRSKSNRNCQPRPSPLRVPWTILMVVLFVDGMMGIERDEHTTNKQTNKEINQARKPSTIIPLGSPFFHVTPFYFQPSWDTLFPPGIARNSVVRHCHISDVDRRYSTRLLLNFSTFGEPEDTSRLFLGRRRLDVFENGSCHVSCPSLSYHTFRCLHTYIHDKGKHHDTVDSSYYY